MGGAGADSIDGGDDADEIQGLGGNDTIDGGSGNDTLAGSAEDDSILGGAGNDVLRGDEGNDTLAGGSGDDTLIAGSGDDMLIGGDDHDIADYADTTIGVTIDLRTGVAVVGPDHRDTLSGIEEIVGTGFDDRITGDAGDNTLHGGEGRDTLWGGAGNDILDGGAGSDVLQAGTGQDVLIGGAGIDTADFSNVAGGVRQEPDDNHVSGAAFVNTLDGIEIVVGSAFDDALSAYDEGMTILGGAGNDTITGFSGSDSLVGGEGTDIVSYEGAEFSVRVNLADGSAILAGQPGDRLSGFEGAIGGARNDTLSGSGNADRLEGREGDDVLDGREGADSMNGGAGDDTYFVDNPGDRIQDTSGMDEARVDLSRFDAVADLRDIAPDVETVFLDDGGSRTDMLVRLGDVDNDLVMPDLVSRAYVVVGGGGDDVVQLHGRSRDYVVTRDEQGGTVFTANEALGGGSITQFEFESVLFDGRVPGALLTGRAIDGYLSGATVFGDRDGDGVLDPGEVSTRTDASGAYTLVGETGRLVAVGGTDTATGLAFQGVLTAPEGSSVITPLTTLVDALERAGIANPVAKVLAAFDLPPNFDLLGTDPVAAAASGDPSGRAAFVAGIAVADTVALLAASLSGATGLSLTAAVTSLGLAFASHLNGSLVDLASEPFLAGLGGEAGLSPAAASATATAAALLNVSLLEASGATDLFAALAATQALAQGSVATALFAAHGDANALAEVAAGIEAAPAPPDPPTRANQTLFGTFVHDISSHGGQVSEFYHGLLGRAPDALGLEFWVEAVGQGASLAWVAQGFLGSSEYAAAHGPISAENDDGFVSELYEIVLGRTGDAAGTAVWTDALSHGISRGEVAAAFAWSAENLAQDHALLEAGVFVADPVKADVARLYYAVMDRAPDAGGLASWSSAVAAGLSETAVAQAFLTSPEYATTHGAALSPEAFVTDLYDGALGRAPDADGLVFWTGALAQGQSRADVALALGQSPEAKLHHVGDIEQGWHLS